MGTKGGGQQNIFLAGKDAIPHTLAAPYFFLGLFFSSADDLGAEQTGPLFIFASLNRLFVGPVSGSRAACSPRLGMSACRHHNGTVGFFAAKFVDAIARSVRMPVVVKNRRVTTRRCCRHHDK
nr:hypothetical protein [Pandoravirus aubagnensis]